METVISADNKNRRGVEANGGLGRLGRLIVVREVLLLRRNSARVLPRLEQNNFPMLSDLRRQRIGYGLERPGSRLWDASHGADPPSAGAGLPKSYL